MDDLDKTEQIETRINRIKGVFEKRRTIADQQPHLEVLPNRSGHGAVDKLVNMYQTSACKIII